MLLPLAALVQTRLCSIAAPRGSCVGTAPAQPPNLPLTVAPSNSGEAWEQGGLLCVPANIPPKQTLMRSPWGIMGLEQGSEDRTELFSHLFRCEDEAPTCCTDPEDAGSATHLDVIPVCCSACLRALQLPCR